MKTKKLNADAIIPTRNNPEDAGLDLCSIEDVTIPKGEGKMIGTGIAFELPAGTVGMICDRSSMGKKGLKVHGGIIDFIYRGEVKIVLWNHSGADYSIKKGEKIAQILVIPVLFPTPVEADDLSDTARGNKGFGSSGK